MTKGLTVHFFDTTTRESFSVFVPSDQFEKTDNGFRLLLKDGRSFVVSSDDANEVAG